MKNSFEVHGLITTIQSTGKNSDLYFTVDTAMLKKIELFTWRIENKPYGYRSVVSGIFRNGKKIGFSLARFLLNFPDGKKVDHIDRNPLNNRLSNLRLATDLENSQNASKHKRQTTSKYKGVCFHKRKKLWFAYINVCNKRHNLGYFKNEIDAATAYNNKIKELNLTFSPVNIL